ILRGGSESQRSNMAIHAAITQGLQAAGLPAAAIGLVPTRDRAAVGQMLAGLGGTIDVIVPRGGKNLVARVEAEARVPVFAHLEGICHVYVDKAACLDMAKRITLNAKMRRTGICGAAETLLVDRACAPTHLKPLVAMLIEAGCEVRGDPATQAADARVRSASEEARSASSSSPASSTACWARGRSGRDSGACVPRSPRHSGSRLRPRDGVNSIATPDAPLAIARARPTHWPVWRHLRSTASGASRRLPPCPQADRTRPGLVVGDPRQSAQGHARAGPA